MIGKLNYFLGQRAVEDGRLSARYMGLDFCTDPSAICRGHYEDSEMNAEIRWIMGMLYWINKVQAYNDDGWNYLDALNRFVLGGMLDNKFLDDVSRIVTRGCQQPSCGNPVSSAERQIKFNEIMSIFMNKDGTSAVNDEQVPASTQKPTAFPSKKPTLAPTPKPSELSTPLPVADPTKLPTTPSPIALSSGTTEPYSPALSQPEEEYTLSAAELAQRLNYANNYCASSIDEAHAKCATTLRTCNFGDPPCTQGLTCWENQPCMIIWADIDFDEPEPSKETDSTTLESPPPESDVSTSSAVWCNGMCLRSLSANECIAASQAVAQFPECLDSTVGDMCETQSGCSGGDAAYTSNCPGGRDIFVRVLTEQCGEPMSDSPTFQPTEMATSSHMPSQPIKSVNGTGSTIYNFSKPDLDEMGGGGDFSGYTGNDDGPGAWWVYDTNDSTHLSFSMKMWLVLGIIAYLA